MTERCQSPDCPLDGTKVVELTRPILLSVRLCPIHAEDAVVGEDPAEAVRLLVEAGALEVAAWKCSEHAGPQVGMGREKCMFGGEHTPLSYRLAPSTEEASDHEQWVNERGGPAYRETEGDAE